MPLLQDAFCWIRYPDGMGHNTMAKSPFEAAANALHWAEVDCQTFRSARRYRDDQVLEIGVGMVLDRCTGFESGGFGAGSARPRVTTVKGNGR